MPAASSESMRTQWSRRGKKRAVGTSLAVPRMTWVRGYTRGSRAPPGAPPLAAALSRLAVAWRASVVVHRCKQLMKCQQYTGLYDSCGAPAARQGRRNGGVASGPAEPQRGYRG